MKDSGKALLVGEKGLGFGDASRYVFRRGMGPAIAFDDGLSARLEASRRGLSAIVQAGRPIYGVTTGFGDSCHRRIDSARSEELQVNLVNYLTCGTGPELSREAVRATMLARLVSLSRGYSGVSRELLDRMRLFLQRDWLPVIPREGSLGASGDLIPLAYVARSLIGLGDLDTPEGRKPAAEVLAAARIAPYQLKLKEGLALVNGTSAMVGLSLVNWNAIRFVTDLAALSTSWLCVAMRGRPDAFGVLVNERAKTHGGQRRVAARVRRLLEEEGYVAPADSDGRIQDRYSLRCAPQVLGPVEETLDLAKGWIETELNGTSDNPLISPEGEMAMGGNFYGGYLAHAMDYLKIALGHVTDLQDRQIALVIDEKSNRGLPANLAAWDRLPEEERYLHHGLKGLHQSISAITSECLAKTMPNSVFSRSAESHNQDKVSLGMSAATSCGDLIESVVTVQTLSLVCLAQALELRGAVPRGELSRGIFGVIRDSVPFVERDTALDGAIGALRTRLKKMASDQGGLFDETP